MLTMSPENEEPPAIAGLRRARSTLMMDTDRKFRPARSDALSRAARRNRRGAGDSGLAFRSLARHGRDLHLLADILHPAQPQYGFLFRRRFNALCRHCLWQHSGSPDPLPSGDGGAGVRLDENREPVFVWMAPHHLLSVLFAAIGGLGVWAALVGVQGDGARPLRHAVRHDLRLLARHLVFFRDRRVEDPDRIARHALYRALSEAARELERSRRLGH